MTRMTEADAAEWVQYMRRNRRAREEYEHSPLTHRNVTGPCLSRCGRTAYTQRGICRYCPKGDDL